jgi:hypothetical protein
MDGRDKAWRLFRIIEADPVGTFGPDDDWAGTNTVPEDSVSVPWKKSRSTGDETQVQIIVFALTAAGALINRGSPEMGFTIRPVEVVDYRNGVIPADGVAPPISANTAVDGLELTDDVTLNRVIDIPDLRGTDKMALRFTDFTNVPGTAATLVVLWRQT